MDLSLFTLLVCLKILSAIADSQDGAVLRSFLNQWQKSPPSWGTTDDPCVTPQWEGVACDNSRVIALKLPSMGIEGSLSDDIGQLSELTSLDLSYNPGLGGPLPTSIGKLRNLTILVLLGCSFTGPIPDELGNLENLTYLDLNSNKFSGNIPNVIGNLSKLYWLDVSNNMLNGPLPISEGTKPGLDQLLQAKHFHFSKNQLSGSIPETLFSPHMTLIHVLFDGNDFTGEIPTSIGFVQTLEVLRLDRNQLSGSVPSNLNNLTHVTELNLANNALGGLIPNLTGMRVLTSVDLSNNKFDPSETPAWFSELETLSALTIETGSLYGKIPEALFSFPQLQQVSLGNNHFNGTLDMGNSISQQLQIVNLTNNNLTTVISGNYNKTLILVGNPACNTQTNTKYCSLQKQSSGPSLPYSTSLAKCVRNPCLGGQSLNPQSCKCAYPFEGYLYFKAPSFRDVTNSTIFQSLEEELWSNLGLTPGYVILQDPSFNNDSNLQLKVKLFPTNETYFSRSEIQTIASYFSYQRRKPPKYFGPYFFKASPYPFPDSKKGSSLNTGLIVGMAVGSALLVIGLLIVTIYALRQRKRAQRAIEFSKPLVSWARTGDESGDIPQLKGARWFSYAEIKKCTNGFSEANEIGSGGYGKVYRGILPGGQIVAIKRARQGSAQGVLEFKTEIEMLSRVHHKNLVALVGFCFEQGEQMLVYEYVPNGTLRESLSGRSGVQLDWRRRLRIALGSARGLAYIHELADPPIIHRDVKTSNILLDDNLSAKVSDFGLSKLVSDYEDGHVSTQVKGTMGYLDPEYYTTQQLTEKSDVYSFGVVMLELICARQPLDKGKYIVREVKAAIDANDDEFYGLGELMDPLLLRETTHLLAFRSFAELALRCVQESGADRPTMNDVVKEIEMILQRDGLRMESTSAGSSATEFGSAMGAVRRHPYDDPYPRKDTSGGSSFECSSGYTLPAQPEPK